MGYLNDMAIGGVDTVRQDIDLYLWREFQEGLTSLLDVPIQLYDANGALLVPASKESPMCVAVGGRKEASERCSAQCKSAIKSALSDRRAYSYKCHTSQHFFAVPVFPSQSAAFVVVVGKVYVEEDGLNGLYEAAATLGLDAAAAERIKSGVKFMPFKSASAMPEIVNNLAAPFLKCLHTAKESGADEYDHHWFKGFYALEQVYKYIAPLLDKEEIYDTVLLSCMDLVGAERGSLMILDAKSGVLSIKASKGLDKDILNNISIRFGEGIAGGVAATGEPVMVADIERELADRRNMAWYKTKSFISMPLRLANRVIGVVNVSDKKGAASFNKEDLLLIKSIANYASIALERGAYYNMNEELKQLSMTDALTGLFNRRYFTERLFEEAERAKRHNERFSLFLLDIDNFKAFNDRYGHSAGDEMLQMTSKTIRDAVRSMDVVARYGGEEFVVLLPHTSKDDSLVIAERIRCGIEEMRRPSGAFNETPTISIGVAECPGDAGTLEELINCADRAMYAAKRMGRNRVVSYKY